MRVEPAAGSGHQVGRHRVRIARVELAQGIDARGGGLGQAGVARGQVGATRIGGVGGEIAGGRQAAPEQVRSFGSLADQGAADHLPLSPHQAAGGLARKQHSAGAGEGEGVGQPGDQGQGGDDDESGTQLGHGSLFTYKSIIEYI